MAAINILKTANRENISKEQLTSMCSYFGLKNAAAKLTELLDEAEATGQTPQEFLTSMFVTEANGRNDKRVSRNLASAHFISSKSIAEYDVNELESGITQSQIRMLLDFNWLDAKANLIFIGPPGLGKTTLANALGREAVHSGYTVAFERMNDFIELLDNAGFDKKAGFRIKTIRKADLVIIDEIGYTPIDASQANRFFNFISAMYETTSFIFTSNKQVQSWKEIFGDADLTKGLLDRILSHSRCFYLKGTSYRMNHNDEIL